MNRLWKWLAGGYGVLLLVAACEAQPRAQPAPAAMSLAFAAPGDTVRITGYWKLPAADAHGPLDSLRIVATFGANTRSAKLSVTATSGVLRFPSTLFPANTAVSGTFCRTFYRSGLATENCMDWTYTRVVAVPPPGSPIDSVTVVSFVTTPSTASVTALATGATPTATNQVQFCGLVGFKTGQIGLVAAQQNIPTCQQALAMLPLAQRTLTTAQRDVLSKMEIQWSVS